MSLGKYAQPTDWLIQVFYEKIYKPEGEISYSNPVILEGLPDTDSAKPMLKECISCDKFYYLAVLQKYNEYKVN